VKVVDAAAKLIAAHICDLVSCWQLSQRCPRCPRVRSTHGSDWVGSRFV